jgi:hypothetical protein
MNRINIDKIHCAVDAPSSNQQQSRPMPNRLRSRVASILISSALFFTAASFGFGQNSDADRAQLLQSQTQPGIGGQFSSEGIENGHAASSPNDADLGEQQILKRVEEYKPWTLMASSPIFYTSNVALVDHGEVSDLVIAPLGALYYQPRITQTLYGLLDVRQQFFHYSKYDGFDFASFDAEAGLSYTIPRYHNLTVRGEYDFNRLTHSDDLSDEFYSNHQIIVGAEVPFRFNRASQLAVGSDINWSVGADHQSPRRNDYEAYANYIVSVTRALSLNASGRLVLRQYHQNGRDDLSEIFSLNANYALTPWCTVSAISSFANSDSNQDVFDYSVANVGGALTLAIKF